MSVSINFNTRVIFVPKSFMTPQSASLYSLDVNSLRLALKAIEDSEGITYPDTHRHNTEVVIAGATFARTFEVINGYTITFEDGQYTVVCSGANHNISDVKNVNQVSLIIGNSAGLIVTSGGSSGGTSPSAIEIRDAVWSMPIDSLTDVLTVGGWLNKKLLTLIRFLSLK